MLAGRYLRCSEYAMHIRSFLDNFTYSAGHPPSAPRCNHWNEYQ